MVYLSWGVGFQEPWQLLRTWGTQACRQWEPWGVLPGTGTAFAAGTGNQAFRQWEPWGLLARGGYQ
jgi:hypothetical protein